MDPKKPGDKPDPLFAPGDLVVPLDRPGVACRVLGVSVDAEPCRAYGGPSWTPRSYAVDLPGGGTAEYSEGFLRPVPEPAPAPGRLMTPHGAGTPVGPAPAPWPPGSKRIRLDATAEVLDDGSIRWHGGFERLYTPGEIGGLS